MKDCKKASNSQYRNKFVLNQRAGALSFVNTTGTEQVRIDHNSGSNIAMTKVANVEIAANNKQTNVTNDQYSTVKNNNHVYIGGDHRENRIGDSYTLVGIKSKEQVEALKNWQESYRELANRNSQFMIERGGQSYPNGVSTQFASEVWVSNPNPTINQAKGVINNDFDPGELQTEKVKAKFKNIEFSPTSGPSASNPIPTIDIETGAGAAGTNTLFDGARSTHSMSTEGIMYPPNAQYLNLEEDIKNTQNQRTKIEQQLGTGGKVSTTIFRDKQEVVGAAFNDYPSVRIDWKGRAQPVEVVVGKQTTFTNVGAVPHVEEVANDSVFPVGNYTIQAGNKFNVTVGSGGVQIKTGGAVDISGTTVKVSGHKINVQSKAGVNIASDEIIELQSPKNISLRSNKQIYIEPGLGVSNNIVVGGGSYTEGEVFVNHITAPVEIQRTEEVELYGKFNTKNHHSLAIGEVNVAGSWRTVYALPADNLIKNYDHAHNFKNVPLRLTQSNADMREIAQKEGINVPGYSTSAHSQSHEMRGITKAEDVTGAQPSKVEPGVILPESPQIGVDEEGVINSAGQFIQKPPPVTEVAGPRGFPGIPFTAGRNVGRFFAKGLKPTEKLTNKTAITNRETLLAGMDDKTKTQLYKLTDAEVGSYSPESQQGFMETVFNRAAINAKYDKAGNIISTKGAIKEIVTSSAYYQSIREDGGGNVDNLKITNTQNDYSGILNSVVAGSNRTRGATHNLLLGSKDGDKWNTTYQGAKGTKVPIDREFYYSKTNEQEDINELLR